MKTAIFYILLLFTITLNVNAQEEVHKFEILDSPDATLEKLTKALEDNPEDKTANYNMAIYYYNQGVQIIEDMDYDAGFESNYETQQEVQRLFKTALPYAEMAHEMNPKEMQTLKMLSGLCFGLNDMEKRDYYEAKLADHQ